MVLCCLLYAGAHLGTPWFVSLTCIVYYYFKDKHLCKGGLTDWHHCDDLISFLFQAKYGSSDRAKGILYRALQACPWAKVSLLSQEFLLLCWSNSLNFVEWKMFLKSWRVGKQEEEILKGVFERKYFAVAELPKFWNSERFIVWNPGIGDQFQGI